MIQSNLKLYVFLSLPFLLWGLLDVLDLRMLIQDLS